MQNEKGEKWSVPKIVKFAEKNKEKYFKKDFPISKLKHELKWWNKQNKEDPSIVRKMFLNHLHPYLILNL